MRRARRRVENLESAFKTLEDRVEAALAGLRRDAEAWKLAGNLQRRVEGLELRLTDTHQQTLAAIEAAHETARAAVNSVKGSKGGRGVAGERAQYEQFGRDIDAALKTAEGRAALIDQVQALENGKAPAGGSAIIGDFTPGPG